MEYYLNKRIEVLESHILRHTVEHRELLERLVRIESKLEQLEIPKQKLVTISGGIGGTIGGILVAAVAAFLKFM